MRNPINFVLRISAIGSMLLLLLFFTSFLISITNTKSTYEPTAKTAEVLQLDGLYVFIQCTPVQPYTNLGSEKKLMTFSGSNRSTVDGVIKKIKEKYPDANGVIFESIDLTKGDAIKFK